MHSITEHNGPAQNIDISSLGFDSENVTGREGSTVELEDTSYMAVISTVHQIIDAAGIDGEAIAARSWASDADGLEGFARSGLEFDSLVPTVDSVLVAVPREHSSLLEETDVKERIEAARAASFLNTEATAEHGYEHLGARTNIFQLIYLIAKKLERLSPVDAHQFRAIFMEYGRTSLSPEGQASLDRAEIKSGLSFLTKVAGLVDMNRDQIMEMIQYGFNKYGKVDQDGLPACGYCQNNACRCVQRPDLEKDAGERIGQAPDMEQWTLNWMAWTMWHIYGIRNNAFGAQMAGVRAHAEMAERELGRTISNCGGLGGYLKTHGYFIDLGPGVVLEEVIRDDAALIKFVSSVAKKEIALNDRLLFDYCKDLSKQLNTGQELAAAEVAVLAKSEMKEIADDILWHAVTMNSQGFSHDRSAVLGLITLARNAGMRLELPSEVKVVA